jgi:hypothetical protein
MKQWMKMMSLAMAAAFCLSAQSATAVKHDQELSAARPSKEMVDEGSVTACGKCGKGCGGKCVENCGAAEDTSCCAQGSNGAMMSGSYSETPSKAQKPRKSAARAVVEGE